jgi:hypothetical protein
MSCALEMFYAACDKARISVKDLAYLSERPMMMLYIKAMITTRRQCEAKLAKVRKRKQKRQTPKLTVVA